MPILIDGIVVVFLNVGILFYIMEYRSTPVIGTTIMIIFYFLTLFQTIGQRLSSNIISELNNLRTVNKFIIRLIGVIFIAFLLFRVLYLIRNSIPKNIVYFLSILDIFTINILGFAFAICAAGTLGLIISYAIKRVKM